MSHPPEHPERAHEVLAHLENGLRELPKVLGIESPDIEVLLVADGDWTAAPRESQRPYPPGLPYFTRAVEPPTLVLPVDLSPAIEPRTAATWPLVVWHELAHAFVLREETVKTPAWLRELIPQAASAAVARQVGLPLGEHLAAAQEPGFTARGFTTPASARDQMAFQNLLLRLGSAMVERFGDGFLRILVRALAAEMEIVGEERAYELLAGSLGDGGREWLTSRPEF